MSDAPTGLCLVGCGTAFDTIAADPAGHGLPEGWAARRADGVATLSSSSAALLEGLDPARTRVFIAVDPNALNYARLELYGAARLRGLRLATLVHQRAFVAPDAKLADNCWIGALALVGAGAQLASDVLLSPGARVDAGARVGMHGWIGPGAAIGAGCTVGKHAVVGADVRLRAGVALGAHCVVDRPGDWAQALPDGAFATPHFDPPARIVGAGYSFQKTPSRA